jgi:hypothetical protein
MEAKENLVLSLMERVEEYGKISIELIKLKSLDKAAYLASMVISRLLVIAVLFLFVITLNIGVAFWLGSIFGKYYYGFLLLALLYGSAGVALIYLHPFINKCINNSIIRKISAKNIWN